MGRPLSKDVVDKLTAANRRQPRHSRPACGLVPRTKHLEGPANAAAQAVTAVVNVTRPVQKQGNTMDPFQTGSPSTTPTGQPLGVCVTQPPGSTPTPQNYSGSNGLGPAPKTIKLDKVTLVERRHKRKQTAMTLPPPSVQTIPTVETELFKNTTLQG